MKSGINNIIFDFGGVILDIDKSRALKAFLELGIDPGQAASFLQARDDIIERHEKGLISPEQFRDEIRQRLAVPAPDQVIDRAWNSILLDFPPRRIRLLEKLAPRYRLFILSNTSSIHYAYYMKMFRDTYGKDFNDLFEKTYWSFQIGMRKPDDPVYRYILSDGEMAAVETLFIDDSAVNAEAARKAGMYAYCLRDGEDICSLFDGEGCLAILLSAGQ
jgi:putative hydrolase of the HAD superfamily